MDPQIFFQVALTLATLQPAAFDNSNKSPTALQTPLISKDPSNKKAQRNKSSYYPRAKNNKSRSR